jgi:hypothetical protein
MAPVLAIAGMVANVVVLDRLFDPVGEILKPFVTGPNSILISTEENRMSDEKPLRNRKERKELGRRLQSENPGAGGGSSRCRRD